MVIRDAAFILRHVPTSDIVDAVRKMKNCHNVHFNSSTGNIELDDNAYLTDEDTISLATQLGGKMRIIRR